LAGTLHPAEAARGLGLSLGRYYQLELRAVAGLVAACEVRRRGGRRPPGGDLAALRREAVVRDLRLDLRAAQVRPDFLRKSVLQAYGGGQFVGACVCVPRHAIQ
jgi:hypothetical protein